MNIVEVLIDSDFVSKGSETIEILHQSSSPNGNCPKEYPFAYLEGTRCCQTHLENHPSVESEGWENRVSNGFLNYDSKECYGESMACEGGCMNHGDQKYG